MVHMTVLFWQHQTTNMKNKDWLEFKETVQKNNCPSILFFSI